MKVAVVGAGISGLAAAHALQPHAQVTLLEAAPTFGGHAHTVDITLPDKQGRPRTHGVDTGFLVYNERTYPRLIQLFAELGVATVASDMSFSVQAPRAGAAPLEWSGTSLSAVFAQRGNLLRPAFWSMLRDLLRFNRIATRLAQSDDAAALDQPLGAFLDAHGLGTPFRDWYLLPMLGCIWSCPTDQMLKFPTATMIRFCHNHGLLQVLDRPQWFTVAGGSRQYVQKIVAGLDDTRAGTPVLGIRRDAAGAWLRTARGTERFDKLVLATHSDTALALLEEPSPQETALLGAIRYQANRAVLHTDVSVLPRRKAAWSAWNYEAAPPAANAGIAPRVCLHYLLNQLQPLPWAQPVIVSLNPLREVDASQVLAEREWAHPVFDAAAIQAQSQLPELQGLRHSYFCGAWAGYGFHEDGLAAGQQAARRLLQDMASAPARAAA
ncbi:FAD-dependent oxidoreductase [Xylophilus rhododendri]|uniref:FAD-dependent oxidoreductase n=1 Tax=Xylophilus rhododendri TaxID=2697032 RepID=A0A857J897_9BURK|nr:FAD-dependent oxidoreductase [Xylophilus rhododendri]QHI99005.1 FAD-dependent oxidoreductase [Xylophilus rhododendri]